MNINYQASALEIANALVGKTVRYFANDSKIKNDGVRVFKVEAVDHVSIGKKSGRLYVTILAKDVDDGGESKHRNLHLAGIDLVV